MVGCRYGSLILGSLEAISRVHPERIVLIIMPLKLPDQTIAKMI